MLAARNKKVCSFWFTLLKNDQITITFLKCRVKISCFWKARFWTEYVELLFTVKLRLRSPQIKMGTQCKHADQIARSRTN